jgi:hypothetical protein
MKKTRKIGSKKTQYVVKKGSSFAHGATIKEAIEDLMYKTSEKNLNQYKKHKTTDVFKKEQLIIMYRVITGACQFGVKDFLEKNKVPNKLSIKEVIKITQGHYGYERFKEFFGE